MGEANAEYYIERDASIFHIYHICDNDFVISFNTNSFTRFNSVAKFSPTKLSQTEFLTNKGINSYLFSEGALDFSPTKRNLLIILEISLQPVGEKCHTI